MNYSTTQGGNLLVVAGALSLILKKLGIDLLPEDIAIILTAIGVCISYFTTKSKEDLTPLGFKK